MPRPRCSVYIAVSLDGYIARTDGRIDWLDAVHLPGEDYGYAEFAASVDALLMGRATWDVVCGFGSWPYGEQRVYVATHRPAEARHGEQFVTGDIPTVLNQLGAAGVRHVYLDGGVLIRQGLAAGVVDALTLSVLPILLGEGIPLFERGLPETSFSLVGSQSWSSGLVQARYTRVGAAAP